MALRSALTSPPFEEWLSAVQAAPRLLRTVAKANMPDTDWAATQTVPAANICANVKGIRKVKVAYVAYDTNGAVVTSPGTCTLALIKVMPRADGGPPVIKTTTVVPNVPVGLDTLGWNIIDASIFTVRVSAQALAGSVTHIDLFWNPSDF